MKRRTCTMRHLPETLNFYRIRSNWCFRCRPKKCLLESVNLNLYQWWSVSDLGKQWRTKTYVSGPLLKTHPYWSMFNITLGPSAAVLLLKISNKFSELGIYAGVLSIRCGSQFWIVAWSGRRVYEAMMWYIPIYVSSDKLMIPRSIRGPQRHSITPISLNGKDNVFQ